MKAEEVHKNVVATLKEMITILKLATIIEHDDEAYPVLFFTYSTNTKHGKTINFRGLCKLVTAVCRKNDPNRFGILEVSPVVTTIDQLFKHFRDKHTSIPEGVFWFPTLEEDEELARSERIVFLETILKSIEHSKPKK